MAESRTLSLSGIDATHSSSLRAVYEEHAVLLRVLAVYFAAGGTALLLMGRSWPLRVTYPSFAILWLVGSMAWLSWQWARSPKRLKAALAPTRVAGALLVATVAVPAQITFQSLKQAMGPIAGWHWDVELAALDRMLHGGPAWKLIAPFVSSRVWLGALDWMYMLWFICLFVLIVWLSWTSRRLLRVQALVAVLLMWTIAGVGVAWLFSSAGPCYYQDVVGVEDPASTQLLAQLDATGPTFARSNQVGLWNGYRDNRWLPFGGISAFPSLHVGFAALIAIIMWHRSRALGFLAWIYAAVMQIGSVVLAWHYAVDGYAGALLAWCCWRLAGRLTASAKPGLL